MLLPRKSCLLCVYKNFLLHCTRYTPYIATQHGICNLYFMIIFTVHKVTSKKNNFFYPYLQLQWYSVLIKHVKLIEKIILSGVKAIFVRPTFYYFNIDHHIISWTCQTTLNNIDYAWMNRVGAIQIRSVLKVSTNINTSIAARPIRLTVIPWCLSQPSKLMLF
jgi:hypothetical protein